METPPSFREARWADFERGLRAWLVTPEGRFAQFCAARQRETVERRALLRRVALAATALPAPCVGCVLRLALVSPAPSAERVLDDLFAGAPAPS